MEIKFRAKSESNGKWIYGHYYNNKEFSNQDIIVADIDGNGGRHYIVDGRTVGQYTGLKDESGKEIYQGDIVRYHPSNTLTTYTEEVSYLEGRFKPLVRIEHGYNAIDKYNPDVFEVIGNIYDNPELFED